MKSIVDVKPSHDKMALFTGMLKDGYHIRLQVTGSSMSPFLNEGSYVTLIRTPLAGLKIGDIIFCSTDDGEFKLHRLLARKTDHLITKGDDLICPDRPFAKSAYHGKVIRIEQQRAGGLIIRHMERPSARRINFLIALAHRLHFHLLGKFFSFILKPA